MARFSKRASYKLKQILISTMKTKLLFFFLFFYCINSFSQISYYDLNPDGSIALSDGTSQAGLLPLDIDADGNADYDFRYDAYSSTDYYLHIIPRNNNQILMNSIQNAYGVNYVEPLAEGQSIGSATVYVWGTVDTRGPLLTDNALPNFAVNTERYIAVRLEKGAGIYKYGWIRVNIGSVYPSSVSVLDYAYESKENTPILAGERQAVPLSTQTSELVINFSNFDNLPANSATDKNYYIGSVISRSMFITKSNDAANTLNGYIKISVTPGLSFNTSLRFNGIGAGSKYTVIQSSGGASAVNDLQNGNPWNITTGQKNWIIVQLNNLGTFNEPESVIELQQIDQVTSCLTTNNQSFIEISYLNQPAVPSPVSFNVLYDHREPIVAQGVRNGLSFDNFLNAKANGWGFGAMFDEESFENAGGGPIRFGFDFYPTQDLRLSDYVMRNVKLYFANYIYDLFRIDRNSIVITKIPASGSPVSYTIAANGTVTINPDPNYYNNNDVTTGTCVPAQADRFDIIEIVLGNIAYTDRIHIEYDLYYCCKKADLFNNHISPSRTTSVYCTYDDDCNTPDLSNWLAHQAGHGYHATLAADADVFSSPSIMLGPYPTGTKNYPDVADFVLEQPNPGGYILGAYYGGSSFPHDFENSYLKIRIKTGSGLRYTAYEDNNPTITLGAYSGEYDHQGDPGSFTYTNSIRFISRSTFAVAWLPQDWRGTPVTGFPGYTRDFIFRISDIPGVLAIINNPGIPYAQKLNTIHNEIDRVLNDSRLWFALEAICGGVGRFDVEYYFNTGVTGSCDLPLTSAGDNVQVNCPGCTVPGAAVNGGRVVRTTYGPFYDEVTQSLAVGENFSSVHTLAEVEAYNAGFASEPAKHVQLNSAIAGDNIQVTARFNMTSATDCASKFSCNSSELKYKFAYLQVAANKFVTQSSGGTRVSIVDPVLSNIIIKCTPAGGSQVQLTNSQYHFEYYNYIAGEKDIFYFRIPADLITPGSIFNSGDLFEFSFETRITGNVPQKTKLGISYMGYFTIDEETVNSLVTVDGRPDLFNRHYAACDNDLPGYRDNLTPETCHFTDGFVTEDGVLVFYTAAQKRRFQMICENWLATLNLYPIITSSAGFNSGLYSNRKQCNPMIQYNNTAGDHYAGYQSTIGSNAFGNNFFPNEMRQAPKFRTLNINVPRGYVIDEIDLLATRTVYINTSGTGNGATLTPAEAAANNNFNTDRVVSIDLQRFWQSNAGVSSTDPAIGWLDENFFIGRFRITLRAQCEYLEISNIDSTLLGGTTTDFMANSTIVYDNPFIGNNGVLEFGTPRDANKNYTPLYDMGTTSQLLLLTPNGANASGNRFTQITRSDFVRLVDLQGQLQYQDPDSYNGNIFIGVNQTQVAQNFKRLKISYGSSVLIDYNVNDPVNTDNYWELMNINTWDKFTLSVEGELNMSSITNCGNPNKILPLKIFYGIHCQENEITYNDMISHSLCNVWEQDLEFDIANVSLNANLGTTTIPDVSLSGVNYGTATFTAGGEQLNELEVIFTVPAGVTADVENIQLYRGGVIQATLTSGSYQFSGNTLTVDTRTASAIQATYGIWKAQNLANSGETFFNEIRVNYSLSTTDCQIADPVNITLAYEAVPFYSEIQCKLTGSSVVSSDFNFIFINPDITNNSQYCQNTGDITLTGNPAGGTWHIDNILSASGVLSTSQTGSFMIRYEVGVLTTDNTITCPASVEETITVLPQPPVNAGPDVNVCEGNTTTTLTATGALSYIWSTGATTASITVSPLTTTIYSVMGTNVNGCSATDEVTVTVNPNPLVTVSGNTLGCASTDPACATVVFTVTSGTAPFTYTVTNASGTVYTGLLNEAELCTEGSYTVTVTDSRGCAGTAIFEVERRPDYRIVDRTWVCNSPDKNICIELEALTDGSARNIRGLDFCLKYDPGVIRVRRSPIGLPWISPTDLGSVVTTTSAVGTSPNAEYRVQEVIISPTEANLHVSIYYTTATPAAHFTGTGRVVCIPFVVQGSPAVGTSMPLEMCNIIDVVTGQPRYELDEAYTLTESQRCYEPGEFTVTNATTYSARLFKANNVLMQRFGSPFCNNWQNNLSATNTSDPYFISAGTTTVEAVDANCGNPTATSTVQAQGVFTVNVTGSNNIKLARNVVNQTQFDDYVNGYDAYLMGLITTFNATNNYINPPFIPTPDQMIAADVNMNDKVRSNDITILEQRFIGNISDYDQTVSPPVDWRFFPASMLTSTTFTRSQAYPNPNLLSMDQYWRDNVPDLPACFPAKAQCAGEQDRVFGILLGDVGAFFSNHCNINAIPTNLSIYPRNGGSPGVKISMNDAPAILDLYGAEKFGNTYKIPVVLNVDSMPVYSVDLLIDYDQTKISLSDVEYSDNTLGKVGMKWNDYNKDQLRLISYILGDTLNRKEVAYYLLVNKVGGPVTASDFKDAKVLINGLKAEIGINERVTGIELHYNKEITVASLHISPQPVVSMSEISYQFTESNQENSILLTDAVGKEIGRWNVGNKNGVISLNAETLASGMYVCRLYDAASGQTIIKRIVVSK